MKEDTSPGATLAAVLLALGMPILFWYSLDHRQVAQFRKGAPNREIPLAMRISDEYSKKISKTSANTEISFGQQQYTRVWKEDPNSREKFTYRLLFLNEEVHGYPKEIPTKFDSKSTVIVYADPNSLDTGRFLNRGSLVFPRSIEGINFLSESERNTEIERGNLERIANVELGPISILKLYDSKIPPEVYRNTIKEWLELSEVAGVNRALAFAKEYDADNVFLKISGSAPDGIRPFGELRGSLFFFEGHMDTNSDYSLLGSLELYKSVGNK